MDYYLKMACPKSVLVTLLVLVTTVTGQYLQPQNLVIGQNTGTFLQAVPGSQGRPITVFQNLPVNSQTGIGNAFFSQPLGTAPATSGTSPQGGVSSSPQFIGLPLSLPAYQNQAGPSSDNRVSQIIARGPDVDTTQSFIGVPTSGAVSAPHIGGGPAFGVAFASGQNVGAAQSLGTGAAFAQGLAVVKLQARALPPVLLLALFKASLLLQLKE
ncbi:uncharacterized protein [Procambarus clarkii]|uniref:uncharacterized protein n=1 Tax=Procambarus clarkii TaxID=6728 RepID=UPI0037439291